MQATAEQPVVRMPKKAERAAARLKQVDMKATPKTITTPTVAAVKVSPSDNPAPKTHIIDQQAMSWYVNPKAFGVATSDRPCEFIPMTLLEEISGRLKRSITLEELRVLVQKESDELFDCACGKCKKKVVPIKWLRIDRATRDAIDKLEGGSLLTIQHGFHFNGSFLANAEKTDFVAFSGRTHGFNKEIKNLHESVYIDNRSCVGAARKMNGYLWPESLERVRMIIEGRMADIESKRIRRENAEFQERFVGVEDAFRNAGILKKK